MGDRQPVIRIKDRNAVLSMNSEGYVLERVTDNT